ncbi:MAG TPA: guanylate kinase [Firmicutes bacterium]|nr:guanylate kinase [Candidatus Fermentithermobacillaceae bacterium]
MSRGKLFVITAPSGCGKGTLRRRLLASDPDIVFCPSVTTRPPRPGEQDGVDYFFLSREEFVSMRDRQELIEWASVYGNLYGTPGKPIEEALSRGLDVILEKDVQGARTLRSVYPEGVFIFVLPPSREELRKRILGRGTETEEERRLRLDCAEMEMSDLSAYDYVIINSDIDRATERLSAIVAGERARSKRRTAHGG